MSTDLISYVGLTIGLLTFFSICRRFYLENNRKKNHSYNRQFVIEHFNEVTKMYYELLERRKKIDYKNKLKNIKNDF